MTLCWVCDELIDDSEYDFCWPDWEACEARYFARQEAIQRLGYREPAMLLSEDEVYARFGIPKPELQAAQ